MAASRAYRGGTSHGLSTVPITGATSGLGRYVTFELVRAGHTVLALPHPATYRDTTMVREAGVTPWSSVADGAAGVLALVTRESGSGRCFDGTSPARAHEEAYDEEVRGRLEKATEPLLRV